jgi:large repetitive protein
MRACTDCIKLAFLLLCVSLAACGGGSSAPSPPPTANAGAAQSVHKRTTVTLDGSASRDPSGRALTFSWKQTSGTSVALGGASTAKPAFTSPGVGGDLVFSLTVNNGLAASSPSTVTVTVTNRAPTAVAGADITAIAGQSVSLNGTGSSDPDGDSLTYTWTQTAGPSVALSSSTTARVSFTAPTMPATLKFSLTVNDGETSSAPSEVDVNVGPPTPVANAGPDQSSPKRALVMLHGTSTDPDGLPLTYSWHQTAGPSVVLQGADTPTPQFTAPATPADLTFQLTVSDGINVSAPSSTTVTVKDNPPEIASLTLSPAHPRRNDQITAMVVTSDPDGDAVTVAYVWKRNGTVVAAATTASYPLGNQAKNDVISVTATASDGTLTAAATASVTIADTPPTLTGTAPTSAVYGQLLTFQVTAADVDGDATGPVEVQYGPAGFSVSAAGVITWTPSGPLFDRSTPMAWQVRLHNSPQTTLGGVITVQDAARQYPLARSTDAVPQDSAGIDVEDFDGTGTQSILVGSQNSLYIMAKSGSDYVQTWMYPYNPVATANNPTPGATNYRAVTSGDVDGDGHREIFFSQGPFLIELDGVNRREVARYGNAGSGSSPAGPYCTSLKYADVDNDGKP